MAISEEERKNGLARIQGAFANPKARAMIGEVLPAVAKKYLTPERITKTVLTAASRDPKLALCTPASMLRVIMEFAPLGLEIGGPLKHVYLVAFWNSSIGAFEVVGIPGYMGYIECAYRTGEVQSICADAIYEGDSFKHVRHEDRDEFLHERKNKTQDVIGYYCRAIFKGGGGHIEHMYVEEIEKTRQRSKAGYAKCYNRQCNFVDEEDAHEKCPKCGGNMSTGPWITDRKEMSKKTCVRLGQKYWPKSWEIAALTEIDNRIDTGEYIDANHVIDAVPTEAEKPAADALADRISGALPNGKEPACEPPGKDDAKPTVAAAPQSSAGAAITGATSGATATIVDPEAPEVSKVQTPDEAKKAEVVWRNFIRWCDGDKGTAATKLAEAIGSDDYRQLAGQGLDDLYGKVLKKIMKEEAEKEDVLSF